MAEENTSEGQPVPETDSLTFFLDHQIGQYTVAKMLRTAWPRVQVHLDHFPVTRPITNGFQKSDAAAGY